jgi:peptide/nickel transport system permease protein
VGIRHFTDKGELALGRYIVKRILLLIPVMLGVVLIVFIFQAISPSDPARALAGVTATDEQVAAIAAKLGLDKPIPIQFLNYVKNLVLHGDLGTSYDSGQPVLKEIMNRFPYTVVLAIGAVSFGVLLGIPLGILSAVKQYTWVDNVILGLSVFLTSFPSFWLGLLLIILFSVNLGWLPANGLASWRGWVLPFFCVTNPTMAGLIRTTRSNMLETIRQDYVRTARAKGQTEGKVIWKHVVRNSLIPVVNNIGGVFGMQLGGVVVIETVFGIPGIGSYAVNAVKARNFPAVLGSVLLLSLVFSIVNLLIDFVYTVVDPKLKITFTKGMTASRNRRIAKRQAKKVRRNAPAAS